jgi:CHAT domain-containing protein
MSIRKQSCRGIFFWPALPVWALFVLAANGAEPQPAQKAKEPPGAANEKRWQAESQARIARLSAEQRRRLDDALALFQRGHQYQGQADYGRAEPLYRQAAETLKELLGDEDWLYLRCLNNLGVLCQDTGDYPQAIRLFEHLLKVYPKHLGEQHPGYALALHNLGDVLQDMGDRQRAEPLLLRSLELLRASLGENNGLYVQNLANLAKLYQHKGDFAQAEKYQLQTLAINERNRGKESPSYAVQLGNLALLYQAQGDFPKAEETLLRAQALKEKLGYQDWPVPGTSTFNLGALYYHKKDFAKAEKHLRQALEIIRRHFEDTVLAQSERRQLNLARSLRSRLDLYLSCALEAHLPPEQVYEEMLAFKGSVFAHQYWQRLTRHRSGNDGERDRLYRQLQETARELSEATFAPPDPKKTAARQERIQQLSERKEKLEAELSQRSATFGNQQAILRQTPARLSAALPTGAALIDFLEFHYVPPRVHTEKSAKAEWRMLAVVVRPGRPLEWRDLGSAQAIAQTCANWRKALTAEETAASPDSSSAANELRQQVWQPLEALLEGSQALLLSPDGALASVPLGALPGSRADTYLLEERAVAVLPVPQLAPHVLNGARSVSEGGGSLAHASGSDTSLLILGDVDFDARPEQVAQKPGASPGLRAALGSRSLRFDRLAGTGREIESIRASFTKAFPDGAVSEMRQADATKQAFVGQVAGKRYLHLATHGFFAPPELQSGLTRPPFAEGTSRSLFGYHPGVLSGLALAGAGSRETQTRDGGDDGILTALEVSGLDLSTAELVVLSACETGLGGSAGGEGLLGLQRAFQIAGARSVLASLWKVDDEATRQLMERFYAKLWQKRLPPLEALRQAQLDILRQTPEPTQPRGPGLVKPVPENTAAGRTHPRLWAAWILSGDPGDLSRLSTQDASAGETLFAANPADPVAERKTPIWPFAVGAGVFVGLLLLLAATRGRLRVRTR